MGVNTKCSDIWEKAQSWELADKPDGEVPGEDKLEELVLGQVF